MSPDYITIKLLVTPTWCRDASAVSRSLSVFCPSIERTFLIILEPKQIFFFAAKVELPTLAQPWPRRPLRYRSCPISAILNCQVPDQLFSVSGWSGKITINSLSLPHVKHPASRPAPRHLPMRGASLYVWNNI